MPNLATAAPVPSARLMHRMRERDPPRARISKPAVAIKERLLPTKLTRVYGGRGAQVVQAVRLRGGAIAASEVNGHHEAYLAPTCGNRTNQTAKYARALRVTV